jgi:choline dehydrogenase-like flavoprotein
MASTVQSSGRLDLGRQPLGLISNHLAEPEDVAKLRSGTRAVLAVCRCLADLAAADRADAARRELQDLESLTDLELDDWLIGHPGPVHHAVGSCRMGMASDGAVTIAEPGRAGTIPGLDGVVVADASLFPDLVAGGLQLPVMAVAERIAAETLLR